MKILKILGIAAGLHVLALILIFANPGCSYTKAADTPSSPISSAPATDAPGSGSAPAIIAPAPDTASIRYSPTRPGTAVASALVEQPVSDVTPASTYVVGRGDSLSGIAKKNHISKSDLMAANSLRSSAVLRIGQKLIIPSKSAPSAVASSAPAPAPQAVPAEKTEGDSTKHIVKPGETLGGIARRYGVKAGEIAVANNISDPKKIQAGEELVIPAKSSSESSAKGAKSKADMPEATTAAAPPPGGDQDLDAGLKPSSPADVPAVKIDDTTNGTQPKNP